MMFIKYAAVHLQQLSLKKQMNAFSSQPQQPAIETSKKEAEPEESNKDQDNKHKDEEAKKIAESLNDSITSREKKEIEESTKETGIRTVTTTVLSSKPLMSQVKKRSL